MNAITPSEKIARRIVGVCALVAGGLAFLAILVRVFGQWSSWVSDLRSTFAMGLCTACWLTLLGAALFVHNRWPQRWGSRVFAGMVAGLVGASGLVAIARLWIPINLEFEAWLVQLLTPDALARTGRLSPHTAGTFLFAATALAFLLGDPSLGQWRRRVVFMLAIAGFGSGAITLMGFALGTPLVYGSKWPSMMMLTAIIFVVLNLGMMLTAFPDNWLLQTMTGQMSGVASAQVLRQRRSLVMILVFLSGGIISAGFFFLQKERANLSARVEQELATVADLKVAQIAEWRHDRLQEANAIFRTPYGARRALDALAEPASQRTRDMFTAWLDSFLALGSYAEAIVLDAKLDVGLVHPPRTGVALSNEELVRAKEAIHARHVTVADLHRPADDTNAVRLSLMVPIIVRREGTHDNVPAAGLPPSAADRGAAVLVLRVDARQTLFPLVKTRPAFSRSAETCLVRRDGADGLYLSDLRFQSNAALRLRFPVARTNSPAALAALGKRQIFSGLDYRGARVLAATRPIPNSPWSLVSKMDEKEIYAPTRERGLAVGVILFVLIIAVGLSLNLLLRRREAELLRWQVTSEQARLVLAERVNHLMQSANDVISITDDQWRILEINERGLQQYGYTRAEFQKMRAMDLRAPDAQSGFTKFEEQFQARGEAVIETVHQRKDGSTFPVEVSVRKAEFGGKAHTVAIIRDITERKEAEQTILAFTRLGKELAAAKTAQEAAEIVMDAADLLFDWDACAFEYYSTEDGGIHHILNRDTINGQRVNCPPPADGQRVNLYRRQTIENGPQLILRESTAVMPPESCPFGDVTRPSASLMFVPVRARSNVIGVLSIQSYKLNAYTRADLEKFQSLADHISGALRRILTGEALRESEALLRAFYDSPGGLRAIVEMVEDDLLVISANASQAAVYGRTPEAMQNVRASELGVPRAIIDLWREKIGECERTQAVISFEYSTDFRSQGGWGLAVISPLGHGPSGRARFAYLVQDITQRKRAEIALQESENRYRTLVETAEDTILTITPDGQFTLLSPAFEVQTGWKREEWQGRDFSELLHPDDLPKAREMLAHVAGGQRSPLFDVRVRKQAGDHLTAQVLATPQWREGKVDSVLAIARDVTDIRQMEEALAAQEARLRMALQNASMVTWEWDVRAGTIRYSENASVVAQGETIQPYCSVDGLLQTVHPEDREPLRQAINRTVTGNAPYDCEYRVRMLDGQYHWILGRGKAVATENGKPVRLIGISTDITERKELERVAQERGERFRALFQNSADGIVVADPETREFQEANPEFTRMLGCSRDELLTMKVDDIHQAEHMPFVLDQFRKLAQGEIQTAPDIPVKRKDGSIFVAEIHAFPLRLHGKDVLAGTFRDVTRRKQAEEEIRRLNESLELRVRERTAELQTANAALRESEERYRLLAETAHDSIFVLDRELRVTYVNSHAAQQFKVEPEEMVGKRMVDLFPPEISTRQRQSVEWVFQTGEPRYAEAENRFPHGSVWLGTWLTPIRDSEGQIVVVMGIARDITERKQAEAEIRLLNETLEQRVRERTAQLEAANEALAKSEAQLKRTAHAGNVGLWDWDLATDRVFFSSEWKAQIGYQDHEISDDYNEWQSRVHPDDRELTLKAIRATLAKLSSKLQVEFRFRHKNGSYRWILVHASVLYGRDGKPERLLGSHVDITDRKRAEEQVHSLARFPSENPSPILRVSSNHEILYANPAAKSIVHGLTDSHGRLKDEWRDIVSDILGRMEKWEVEREIGRRSFLITVSPFPEQGYANLYCQDITELKRLQQQLLEVSDREQARFGRELHDGLCQLLVSVAFDLSRMEKRTASRGPEVAARVQKTAQMLDEAITQARSLARGLFAVHLAGEGLPQALRDLAANVSARHGIACEVHCPETVPIADNTIATHLFRLVQEAVNNAVKHAKPHHIEIRVAVKAGRIEVQVNDDGIGFKPESRLWRGMGLHIMDYRAHAVNGTLEIQRGPAGKGTRVHCSMPADQS